MRSQLETTNAALRKRLHGFENHKRSTIGKKKQATLVPCRTDPDGRFSCCVGVPVGGKTRTFMCAGVPVRLRVCIF